jgi:dTDP-4-amino-4,6-dideoxygalactose transaminase
MYRKAHATGGCGGVVFTRDEGLYRLVRAHADRGKPFWRPDFNEKDPTTFLFPALNFHQDEMACAIGLSSLQRLDDTIRRRTDFLRILGASVTQHSTVCSPTEVSDDDSPFFHPIRVDATRIACSKREFAEAVRAEGIDLNPNYMYVVGEWPWAAPHLGDGFVARNAIAYRDSTFNILFNEQYGAREAEDIAQAIAKVEAAYRR